MSLIGLKPNGLLPMSVSNPIWGAFFGVNKLSRGYDAFVLSASGKTEIPDLYIERKLVFKYRNDDKLRQKELFRNLTLFALYVDQCITQKGSTNVAYDYKRYISQKYMEFEGAPFFDRNNVQNISFYYGKFYTEVVKLYLSQLGFESVDSLISFNVSQVTRHHGTNINDNFELRSYQTVKKPWIYS